MRTTDNLSDEQKGNLKTLSAYLKNMVPPPGFNMKWFLYKPVDKSLKPMAFAWYDKIWELPSEAEEGYNECGTVACALGHGPKAGIPAIGKESWNDYALRAFGVASINFETNGAFEWLFGAGWSKTDNTPKGAAARIDQFLREGITPVTADLQRRGQASLSYNVLDEQIEAL